MARIKLHNTNNGETPLVVRFMQMRSTWGINEPAAKVNRTLSSKRSANRSASDLFKRCIRTFETRWVALEVTSCAMRGREDRKHDSECKEAKREGL